MPRSVNALIVDDSTTTRKMVMKILSQTGLADFAFAEACDGLNALDKYRPGQTEIIFVDMNMPRMDGLEFIRELRARFKKCPPTVIITAESSRDRLVEAINQPGVDALLLKPVDRDRLQSGLRKLVDSIPERSGPCVVPHGDCVPQALQEVLAKACGLELSANPMNRGARAGKIVLGMISLHGSVDWSVVLGFTRDSARTVASRFAGYEIPAEGPDIGDAIGEVTNIIGGRIKHALSAKGLTVNVSLPTVVSAAEFQVLLRHKSASAEVQFNSPAGELWTIVTVGIHAEMIL